MNGNDFILSHGCFKSIAWNTYSGLPVNLHIETKFQFCNFNSQANLSGFFRHHIRWLFWILWKLPWELIARGSLFLNYKVGKTIQHHMVKRVTKLLEAPMAYFIVIEVLNFLNDTQPNNFAPILAGDCSCGYFLYTSIAPISGPWHNGLTGC